MKILFVDATVREGSRTLELSRYLLGKLEGDIREVRLNDEKFLPLYQSRLERRMQLQSQGNYDDPIFDQAREFASADVIVIAAPYWDLSFPAILKTYLELICAIGITFTYNEDEEPVSLCRATRLVYVTTAGGKILCDEPGFGYVRTLVQTFFGIARADLIKAEGLDLLGADVEAIMSEARQKIDAYISGEW